MPMHIRHASIISWPEYTNNHYNQQKQWLLSNNLIFLSQAKIKMNEERGVGEKVNGEREHKERCEP
jgi:hypothetical protein